MFRHQTANRMKFNNNKGSYFQRVLQLKYVLDLWSFVAVIKLPENGTVVLKHGEAGI